MKPTTNGLINMEVKRTRDHSYEHDANSLNKLQQAYLELRDEWGINYPLEAKEVCRRAGYAVSTYSRNFCGGIRGFLALSEQVVINRFTEAVEGRDFQKGLYNGFLSLLRPIKFSDYNTNRQIGVDMAIRTEFCYRVFGLEYWKLVINPLLPAIDGYLSGVETRWNNVSDKAKGHAYDLFTAEFHWIVGLLIDEYKKQLDTAELDAPLDDYVSLFEQYIRVTVRLMFSEPLLRDTLFEKRMKRIKD